MLSVLLLGPPQIRLDGRIIEVERRKSRAVLYYLAARPEPVLREQLLTLFWPDHERAAAQQVLRTTVHGLRKALGPALVVTPENLTLTSATMVDTHRFEAQIAAPNSTEALALALALYRGPLLEGFTLPDGDDFTHWLEGERARMHQLAVHGAVMLARQHEAQQNFPAALSTLARGAALDPLHEEIQRATMRVQYRSGDRAGAIRRYEQLRDQLDAELGVPPMPETRELYDAIITEAVAALSPPEVAAARHGAGHAAPPDLALLPFIGRTDARQRITGATNGQRLALLDGEPGIGKTRLAQEWLANTGACVLASAAHQLERSMPYQPIIDALRGLCERTDLAALRADTQLAPIWRTEVARLLPELLDTPISALPADESRLWEGVRQLLLSLARRQPVVLFLDDLHWADESTLALFGYLIRQSGDAPIGYVAAARPVPARSGLGALLQSLSRANRLERITLQRFSVAEVQSLAQQISPTDDPQFSTWLAQASEGNLYVLAELVRHAREQGWLRAEGRFAARALVAAPVVPLGVLSLIESRLAALSPHARQVLDLAVAIGREFEFAVVVHAAAMPEEQVLDALDELREAGLVRPVTAARFSFDHTLTMEVAYREIGEPRHQRLHRQIAEALEQVYAARLDDVAGLIASHYVEGAAPELAALFALRAGRRAADLAAWQEAVSLFELALGGAQPALRAHTLLELGRARNNLGMAAAASEALREAVRLAERDHDDAIAAAARIELARSLLPQGRFAEVAAAVAPLDATNDAASAAFFRGAALSLEGADLAGATKQLRASARLLLAHPEQQDVVNLARVKFELGSVAAQQGQLDEAVQRYREVLAEAALNAEALPWYVLAHNNLAYHLHLLGDPHAIEYARTGLQLAHEKGTPSLEPYLRSTIGEILLAAGDLAGAEQSFITGLALAEQFGIRERIAGLTANLGLVAARRGQAALAIHQLSTAMARADALGTQHLAAQIRLWLAPLLPPEQAHALLAEARAIAESGGRTRLLAEIDQIEGGRAA